MSEIQKLLVFHGYNGDVRSQIFDLFSDLKFLISLVVMDNVNVNIKQQVAELKKKPFPIKVLIDSSNENLMDIDTEPNETKNVANEFKDKKPVKNSSVDVNYENIINENATLKNELECASVKLKNMSEKEKKSQTRIKELQKNYEKMNDMREELENKCEASKKINIEKESEIETKLTEEIIKLRTIIDKLDLKIKKNEFLDTADFERQLENQKREIKELKIRNVENLKEIEQLKDSEKMYNEAQQKLHAQIDDINREKDLLKDKLEETNSNNQKLIIELTKERDYLTNELHEKDIQIKELEQWKHRNLRSTTYNRGLSRSKGNCDLEDNTYLALCSEFSALSDRKLKEIDLINMKIQDIIKH